MKRTPFLFVPLARIVLLSILIFLAAPGIQSTCFADTDADRGTPEKTDDQKPSDPGKGSVVKWKLVGFHVERYNFPSIVKPPPPVDLHTMTTMIPEGSTMAECTDLGPETRTFPLQWSDGLVSFNGSLELSLPGAVGDDPFPVKTLFKGTAGEQPPNGISLTAFQRYPVLEKAPASDNLVQTYTLDSQLGIAKPKGSASAEVWSLTNASLRPQATSIIFEGISFPLGAKGGFSIRVIAYYTGPGAEPVKTCSSYKVTLTARPWMKQIVPGQRSFWGIKVRYDGTQPVQNVFLRLRPAPQESGANLLGFTYSDGTPYKGEPIFTVGDLNPGDEKVLLEKDGKPAKAYYQIADEDHVRILDEIIKKTNESIVLTGQVAATISLAPLKFDQQRTEIEVLPTIVSDDGSPARIEYPDFSKRLGTPGLVIGGGAAGPEELSYNMKGDPGWLHPDKWEVRKMAIRAARYNEKEFNRYSDFPDGAYKVARNIRMYVYHLLNPKGTHRKSSIRDDFDIAVQPPSKLSQDISYEDPGGYVCIEHAYFFTSLLRTLGIPAKEANSFVFNVPTLRYQTAAALAWTDDSTQSSFQWQYLDPYYNVDKPEDYNAKLGYWFAKTWYGIRSTSASTVPVKYYWTMWSFDIPITEKEGFGTRFEMVPDQMDSSEYWKRLYPIGPEQKDAKGVVVFAALSPVRLSFRNASGQTTGAVNVASPQGGRSEIRYVTEIPGSEFLPAGSEFMQAAAGPVLSTPWDQIILQSERGSVEGKLSLVGMFDGGYRFDILYYNGNETVTLSTRSGQISKGQKIDIPIRLAASPGKKPEVFFITK